MEKYKQLPEEIGHTAEELLKVISLFSQEEFNRIPYEGSWTAAMVAEHLRKANGGIAELLYKESSPASRPADERVEELRGVFLNYDLKMKSPAFIIPDSTTYNKEQLAGSLQSIMAKIKDAAQKTDLSFDSGFAFPGQQGTLTRLELVSFVMFHTQRHTRQLKNILQRLKAYAV